ncbi:MAG TPA: hypothetical protein VI815_03080 [Candidatus Nanoarchaeia archaeon]|nr:hypothetical protein [Candidatus Nanoarchaeia archaeon]
MIYFIYKTLQITGIGGVSIPTIDGINGGQGSYKEWLLGTTDSALKLSQIKEFQPRILKEEIWRGLSLIGLLQVFDTSMNQLRNLTPTEIIYQKAATNWEFKENARNLIEITVGDPLKQIANVDQQSQLTTPVIVRMYKLVLALYAHLSLAIPEDILPAATKSQYDNFTDLYLYKIGSLQLIDRIDVDPDPAALIDDVLTNIHNIGLALKTEYYDKKV